MKNPYQLLLWLLLPLLYLACSTKEDVAPGNINTLGSGLTPIDFNYDWSEIAFNCDGDYATSSSYLHGYVNEQEVCYAHGIDSITALRFISPYYIQSSSGADPVLIGRRLGLSFQQFPSSGNREYFELTLPVLLDTEADVVDFLPLLTEGDLPLATGGDEEEGFVVRLKKTVPIDLNTLDEDGNPQSLSILHTLHSNLGAQQGSSLKLLSFEKEEHASFDKMRYEFSFACKLYAAAGEAAVFELTDMRMLTEFIIPK